MQLSKKPAAALALAFAQPQRCYHIGGERVPELSALLLSSMPFIHYVASTLHDCFRVVWLSLGRKTYD